MMINNSLLKRKQIFTWGFFLLLAIALQPLTIWAADDNPQQGNQYYLFMGQEGVGVSTIINYILGHQFEWKKGEGDNESKLHLVKNTDKKVAKMSNNNLASTAEEVQAYPLDNNNTIQLVDTPGFNTKNIIPPIANFVKPEDRVGAIICVLDSYLITDHSKISPRMRYFSEVLNQLNKLLIRPADNMYAVHFLINNFNIERKKKNYEEEAIEAIKIMKDKWQKRGNTLLHSMSELVLQYKKIHFINPLDKGESRKAALDKIQQTAKTPLPLYIFSNTGRRQITEIQDKLTQQDKELERLKNMNNQFEILINKQKNDLDDLQNKKKEQEKEIKQLKKEKDQSTNDSITPAQLQEKITEINNLNNTIAGKSNLISEKNSRITELNSNVREKERKISEQENKISDLKNKVNRLERQSNQSPTQDNKRGNQNNNNGNGIGIEGTVIICVIIVVVGWLASKLLQNSTNKQVQQTNRVNNLP